VRRLLAAGVRAFQLREKDLDPGELHRLAATLVPLCHSCGAFVSINSSVEVAVDSGADGVHLPAAAAAAPALSARSRGPLIVGCSVHTLDEALKRQVEGVDYVSYSPIYPTAAKPGYGPARGLGGLRRVAAALHIPVFALGGIGPAQVAECLAAGAYGVAVMSGLMREEGGEERARQYVAQTSARQSP